MNEQEKAARLLKDPRKREILADIVGSEGWTAFIEEVVKPYARHRREDALNQIRSGDLAKSQACLAAAEAGAEIIFLAYEGTGQEIPEAVRAIRRIGLEA